MPLNHHTWAVVLAAGEGSRLRSLTTDPSGRSTPKQYCSLFGGTTLLQDALRRAHAVAGRERSCAIVAEQHAEWWRGALWPLPGPNVIVQPQNRGTANGVLLSLLAVLARDPLARLLFLPADHFVENEARLAAAMRTAVVQLAALPDELFLVGIEPEEADPELGYIVPAATGPGAHRVRRFVEKPSSDAATHLLRQGALWNSFIFAATGPALLGLFRRRMPGIVDAMETALARGDAGAALAALYATLPSVDFSRDVVAGAEQRLRVVAAAPCGWSDLGTPRRVGAAIVRAERSGPEALSPLARATSAADASLAAAYLRPRQAV
jgi:mannose-1-phosphate guanylyltransferase